MGMSRMGMSEMNGVFFAFKFLKKGSIQLGFATILALNGL